MNLTRISVKNPAAMIVIVALILVFGVISLIKLPIQLLPNIERPTINISTGWRAASPQELESVIIEPQEFVVKNTPGVEDIQTNINQGSGNITLTFAVGTDMQKALLDVINNLNQAPPLPLDATEPVVTSGGAGNGTTAASLLIRPVPGSIINDLSPFQDLIEDVVEPRLRRIDGVGFVNLASRRPRELRISYNPHKMAALGVQLNQVSRAVSQATDVSGGVADVGRRQYTVRFVGQYDVANLADMIVAWSGERPIFLKDVADVKETLVDRQAFSLRNGFPGYYITITRANGANTVELLDDINAAISDLNQGALGEVGLMLDLSFDASVHIRNAIKLVNSNLGLGVILALGILYFFLRGLRTTLIIATTIPISLMVAFLALSALDRSLNVISLAGVAFAVGMVLDAAIIVQENIVRLKHQGLADKYAILKGTAQVSGALFASTVTSVAIFLPILFMQGVEGQLFSDLALTLSIAVISSMIAAITLLPVLSKFWLAQTQQVDPFAHYWQKLTSFLMALTDSALKRTIWISGLLGGSLAISVLLMPRVDFLPRVPIDGFFYTLAMPPGGNLEFVENEIAEQVKSRISEYMDGGKEPAIKNYNFYSIGSNNTGGFIYSADPQRVEELMQVAQNEIFAGLPDTLVFLQRGSMLNFAGGGGGAGINIDIQGPDIEALMEGAKAGMASIAKHMPQAGVRPFPGVALSQPELQLAPNDRRIAQAGLSRGDVARAVRAATSGLFVSEYFDGNERMNVILRGSEWQTPEQLATMPIYTPLAGVQNLGELTEIRRTVGPTQLRRVDGKRTISLFVFPSATTTMEEALDIIKQNVIPDIKEVLPESTSIQLSGNADQLGSAIGEMIQNFVLALLILFLIMTALFKSPKDSFLVLLAMPLAVAGGMLALKILNLFTFQSLDLLTMIGFIILLGLVVNNAILLVDQTRQGEQQGLSRKEAVAQAVAIRARPVYMSTLTSLFGMLPLMLMPGTGSEIYRGLATVIVGGLAISAMFTLVLLPSLLRIGEDKAEAEQQNDNVLSFEPSDKLAVNQD